MGLNKTTSYAGAASAEYIRQTFFEAASLQEGIFTVKERVSRPWKIRRLASSGLIQDKSCDFNNTGDVDVDERVLTPADLQVNLEICKDDFKGDWDEAMMGAGAMNKSLPKPFTDALRAEINETVGESVEFQNWQGSVAGTDQYDGIETLATADSNVPKPSLTSGGAAVGTILADFATMKAAAVAAKIASKEDFVFIVSPTVADIYGEALLSAGSGQENYSKETPLMYRGVQIFVSYGKSDSNIIAARKSNLFFGTDLLSDMNAIVIKDMSDTDLSDNVRFKQVMTGGVNYGWSGELIFGVYL
jgi:hypothetical protein